MNASSVVNSFQVSYQQVRVATYREGVESEANESVSENRYSSQSRSLHKNSIANALYTAHESTQSVKTLKYILHSKQEKSSMVETASQRSGNSRDKRLADRSRGANGANMFNSRTTSKVT